MTEFYLKMAGTFVLSGLIFLVMMRMQKRKEQEAARKADLLLMSKGVKNYKGENYDSET